MALPKTFTFIFSGDTFTDSKPIFSDGSVNNKGLKYSNQHQTIELDSTNYGYIHLEFTFIGSASYAGISFRTPPPIQSTFSVGENGIDGLFLPFIDGNFENFGIDLTPSVTKSLIMIVNTDPNKLTDKIEILGAVGVSNNVNPGNDNIIIVNYECIATPLYSYDTGLHVYSPYDSIYTPKLDTYLYSKTPIASWAIGTRVWADATFAFPAFQYYYGYGNNVYKVGGPLDRSYGTMEIYNVWQTKWRKLWHKQPVVNLVILGPTSFKHPLPDDTIEACINVLYTKAGIITQIIPKASLPQPSKYKYYMGYDASSKQLSNDNFFVTYLFTEKKFFPITGFQHVMMKLTGGYIESMGFDFAFGRMNNKWMLPYAASGVATAAITIIRSWPIIAAWITTLVKGGAAVACVAPPISLPALVISAVLIIIGIAISLFAKSRMTFIEPCKQFLSEYTTTPYIEVGSQLSRLQDMSQKNIGYYCDGVYFYTQPTISGVTIKELSSTNALISKDPIKIGFLESLMADVPTTVTNISKLFLLPYTSGIPVEFGVATVYYSTAITEVVTITECAELIVTPPTVTYTLPLGYCISFISQVDADTLAAAVAVDVTSLVQGRYTYGDPLSEEDLGIMDSYFTHKIRVETNPTICTVFFDNRDHLGLTVGKKVFFDVEGRYEAMKGYYATDDNLYFRIFYKIENGVVTNKYIMIASNSTTVQGLGGAEDILYVDTSNLLYSSNWYIKSIGQGLISNLVNEYYSNRCFDPNTLYGEDYLVRGYYNNVNNRFLLYDDNYNNYTTAQAPSGWYQPLIEWINSDMFYYDQNMSISINIEEICLPSVLYQDALYGFYVVGSANGNLTPLYNEVNLTVNVYVGVTLKHTYTVITEKSGKTYVPYGPYVSTSENVTSIVITSINGTNPIGKITYTIGTFTSCIQGSPLCTDPLAYWKFEESSGIFQDSTVHNNDLTPNGSIGYQSPGKLGYSVSLFGSNANYLSNNGPLAINTVSWAGWIKITGVSTVPHYVFETFDSVNNGNGYRLLVSSTGYLAWTTWISHTGSNIYWNGGGINLLDGNWHHIAATATGTSVKLYIDGVASSVNTTTNVINVTGNGLTLVGMGSVSVPTKSFEGYIDELGVWNRILTDAEILQLYNGGAGHSCS